MGQTCGILPVGVDTAHVKTEGLKWDVGTFKSQISRAERIVLADADKDWDTSLEGNLSTSNHLLPENPIIYLKTDKPILWCVEIRDPLPSA